MKSPSCWYTSWAADDAGDLATGGLDTYSRVSVILECRRVKAPYSADRGHIDLLDSPLRLNLRVDPRSRSRCGSGGFCYLRPLSLAVGRTVWGTTADRAARTTRVRLPA